jgi:DNA-binding SARP family transcriptional activator
LTQLKLFLLGSTHLEREGTPVEVDTRKAIALVAYLAVTGRTHSRDALATLLWPDYDQSHARAALRRTLSTLNKALGGEGLEVDREAIGLHSSAGIWTDVGQFQLYLAACREHDHPADTVCRDCLARLTEAVNLYRADFMAGFTLRDSPDFDEWQFFQTETLRRELANVLEKLVHCHSLLGEWDAAITYARRWLALDPLHEPAHRRLMQLYAWAGQRAAGLRQYRECVRILDQELGVAPLEETNQLYQAIKENQVLPTPVEHRRVEADRPGRSNQALPATLPLPAVPALLPLVGRSAE